MLCPVKESKLTKGYYEVNLKKTYIDLYVPEMQPMQYSRETQTLFRKW